MRTLILAGLTMVTALAATAADAQRIAPPGAPYPMPGQQIGGGLPMARPINMPAPPMMNAPRGPMQGPVRQMRPEQGSRWGGAVNGRWAGGSYAPGGWNAYHRPSRGWRVPNYWVSPTFYVDDYASYGLWAPPSGYRWHRYYDDAVLIDARGKVWDSRGGIDWDGAGYGYDDGYDRSYDYAQGRPLPAPVQHGAMTTYSTSGGYSSGYSSGGYSSGGYYYPGATTTVMTIQTPPTITTTTTEYVETMRTRYVASRRVYHAPRKVWHPVRCACRKVVHVERPIQGS